MKVEKKKETLQRDIGWDIGLVIDYMNIWYTKVRK
jgi:hypothetical protein